MQKRWFTHYPHPCAMQAPKLFAGFCRLLASYLFRPLPTIFFANCFSFVETHFRWQRRKISPLRKPFFFCSSLWFSLFFSTAAFCSLYYICILCNDFITVPPLAATASKCRIIILFNGIPLSLGDLISNVFITPPPWEKNNPPPPKGENLINFYAFFNWERKIEFRYPPFYFFLVLLFRRPL